MEAVKKPTPPSPCSIVPQARIGRRGRWMSTATFGGKSGRADRMDHRNHHLVGDDAVEAHW
jgi:hypothetical protein